VRRDTRIPTWKGEYVLSVDGRADQVLKPGDWFGIPAEVPHSVRYDGGRALGHYVVERVEAGT
jgi:quercetin dioxygenase-like cupin family protein